VLVKSLTAAGFKATPVATTLAQYTTDRENVNSPINIRAYGWCSDWPSGSTWIPPILGSTDIKTVGFGANQAAFSEPSVDAQIKTTEKAPISQQPTLWNNLDKSIMTKYFPVIPQWYTGIAQAHGSKIQGHYDDNTLGMPTWKDIWVSK